MAENPAIRRRWFRFSLRTLFLVVTVVGVIFAWLGWWFNGARQQKDAIDRLRQLSPNVVILYDHQLDDDAFRRQAGFSNYLPRRRDAVSWVPSSILNRVGSDYFHSVTYVALYQANRGEMDKVLAAIGRMPKIRNLLIHHCPSAGRSAWAELSKLRSLSEFSLDGFVWTPDRSNIADDALRALRRLPGLQHLSIANALLTDNGMAYIAEMSHLTRLDLRKATVTDQGLAALAAVTTLEELILEETEITGAGFGHLGALTKLRNLDVTGSPITDDGLASIARLASIEDLNLRLTYISDAGLAHLERLTNLKSVNIEEVNVTAGAKESLYRMHPAIPSLDDLD